MLDSSDTLQVIVIVAAFGAAMALEVMVVLAISLVKARRAERIDERLGLSPTADRTHTRQLRLWHDGKEAIAMVPGARHVLSPVRNLQRLCRDAGVLMPLAPLMGMLLVIAVVVGLLAYALSDYWLIALVCALAVPMVAQMYLGHLAAKRFALMDRQLVDGMLLASRSLRAGHPLIAAFRLISEEISAPVGSIFGKICQQQQLGVSLEDAMREAAAQSGHDDMKLFTTSVTIQLRSGGNLASTIERLASVISDRISLSRRVRVLTAQTQFSKRLLLAMPLLMFVVLMTLRPDYMERLHGTEQGRMLLAVAAAGMVLGAWSMNRLARIKY